MNKYTCSVDFWDTGSVRIVDANSASDAAVIYVESFYGKLFEGTCVVKVKSDYQHILKLSVECKRTITVVGLNVLR